MSIHPTLAALRADPDLGPGFVTCRELAAEPAQYGDWPADLDPPLLAALARQGIDRPYRHQAAMIAGALAGQDQVVVTPTASGKSLGYVVPVLDAVARDADARALLLFPTKALAQDQLQTLHSLVTEAGLDVKACTYDGDTPPAARRAVRSAGHVVITNPDMLHAGILPHHTKWVRLFENLRYVVIDELHTYRGLFGSHVAQVLRRLQRLCRFYGADPVFLFCSATIANPQDLAERLCGRRPALIDTNGAPRAARSIAIYNPPIVNAELGLRGSVVTAATQITSRLQQAGLQTICFTRSRQGVEVLTHQLREAEAIPPGVAPTVRGYRSGYLPRERRAIEAGLRAGEVETVVATNALELGIDIGGLDAAVLAGYPGTRASTWQQLGRAGRRSGDALGVLITGSSPLDQYVAAHPEYLFDASVESGVVNPDNPIIAAEHLKCAVFELPLDADEYAALGPRTAELVPTLLADQIVSRSEDRLYWASEAFPAAGVALRGAPDANVVIIERGSPPRVIGEIDRFSARTRVHTDAIYLHDGRQYHVEELDWAAGEAYVRPVDVDYYTDAQLAVDLKVLSEWEATTEPTLRGHGEVAVTSLATLFKKVKLHTHENVGWGQIDLPQDDLQTSAFWVTLPPSEDRPGRTESALQGLGALLVNVAALRLMADPQDLQVAVQVRSPHTGRPTVILWEPTPGGVGLAERLYRDFAELVHMAVGWVRDCPCLDGCPSCVGPPVAGLGAKAPVQAVLAHMEQAHAAIR